MIVQLDELERFAAQPATRAPALGTKAVILAGGRGTRLAPYTSILPKPLVPLGDRAVLELIVDRLAAHGIREIVLCVGHLAHLVEAVFGDGSERGVHIRYVRELEPLGTAGPLQLAGGLTETFVAMNGDVLTTLDFGLLLERHRRAGNALTIAATTRRERLDYGVLQVDGSSGPLGRLTNYEEKPVIGSVVSMGIYAVEPSALERIPKRGRFDVPDLVRDLLAAAAPVGVFLHDGFWVDLGRREDYETLSEAWARLPRLKKAS